MWLISCGNNGVEADYFGDEITLENSTSIQHIVRNSVENAGQEFLIQGVMTEVCQKKGCWVDVKDGEESITVRFKDYAFFMPKDGAGRNIKAQGVFNIGTYEEEVDGKKVEKEYFTFTASGVELEKRQ
jgi:hypothetical protein